MEDATKIKRLHLPGLYMPELEDACVSLGQPAYRAKQIADWFYGKGVQSFDEMRNLPADFRSRAAQKIDLYRSAVEQQFTAADGTMKLLLSLNDGARIETVVIPEADRLTCCVSSQVGCAMACAFCASGRCGFERSLAPGEIVEQALHAGRAAGSRITHVVVMGVGEPLANFRAVVKAVRIINADWALGIAARRITVSSVGFPEAIERLAAEGLQINLAISLHAPNDRIRNKIVPANRKVGIDRLLHAGRHYFAKTGREITFEYVLIAGINDGMAAAEELARRLKDYPCTVNVIPYNPVHELGMQPPTEQGVQEFIGVLHRRGIKATVRRPRGVEISAACGQLRASRIRAARKGSIPAPGPRSQLRASRIRAARKGSIPAPGPRSQLRASRIRAARKESERK
ncbi:MAG TPA: 23S rRNA (adenine(2503)-C(2))-methyltransferase RlmN [Planctomycetota bacterium]|nr:23S rRNA (adenine(2503)-C(2))-methyltransferase RlmN [Planctomycetota bacterium]